MPQSQRIFAAGAIVCIGVYFFALTHETLHSFFALDDTGNLYRAWHYPLSTLLKANFLFFTNTVFPRPMGSAWYRSIYWFAGYNAVPFHIVHLSMLAANVWLTYLAVFYLAGSREVGAFAALLFAYHPKFAAVYFDTAYVFDVLCYLFYLSALILYIRIRQRRRVLTRVELIVCSALYICALNSKEMAVTLPIIIVVYELLYRPAPRDWRFTGITAAITILFVIGHAMGADTVLTNSAYRPVFTWDRFIATSRSFTTELFLQTNLVSSPAVIGLWIILLAIACITQQKSLQFAWLFLTLPPIPVAFIEPRGAAQYYIPLFGWVLFAAVIVVGGSRKLLRDRFSFARATVMLSCTAIALYAVYHSTGWSSVGFVSLEGEMLRAVSNGLREAHPSVRPKSRLLVINDPMGPNALDVMFLVQLTYRDPDLTVDRVKATPDAKQIAAHDYVFDYQNGRFHAALQPRPTIPQPAIVFEWGQPAVFHSDWIRVSEDHPAKPGEVLIAMVSDLGATPTQRFPKQQLIDVASPLQIRVSDLTAEVSLKIGWPEQINRYRVDFRIPKNVPHRSAKVVVTTPAGTGPEVEIPVQ